MKKHANDMLNKVININRFKSYSNSKVPSFFNDIKYVSGNTYEEEGYSSWGKIPYGFIVEDINKESLGKPNNGIFEKDLNGNTVFQNSMMMATYYEIEKAVKNAEYYRYCKKENRSVFLKMSELSWSELLEDDTPFNRFICSDVKCMKYTNMDYLREASSEYEYGDIICVSEFKDFFENLFPPENNESYSSFQKRVEGYVTFVKKIMIDKRWWNEKVKYGMIRPPLLKLSLLIEEEIEDGGIFDIVIDGENENGNDKKNVNATSSSQLYQLKGTMYSIDDEGRILPFVIGEEYKDYLVKSEECNTYLPFLVGTLLKTRYRNGIFCGSFINSIEINGNVAGNEKKIVFDYIIDGEIDTDGGKTLLPDTGIHYKDTCYAKVKTDKFNFEDENGNKEERSLTYLDIIYSDISSISYVLSGRTNKDVILFKTDSTIHNHDYSENIDISVDRGSYAAFERHNILSEINTMEDLENYRNDFFKIKN